MGDPVHFVKQFFFYNENFLRGHKQKYIQKVNTIWPSMCASSEDSLLCFFLSRGNTTSQYREYNTFTMRV